MILKPRTEAFLSWAIFVAIGFVWLALFAVEFARGSVDPIVLEIRFPEGQEETHREVFAGGSSIAVVPVENFEGASIYARGENWFVGVLYRINPEADTDPAEPDPQPQPDPMPDPDPQPDPEPGFELPAVVFEATSEQPASAGSGQAGFTAFATGENDNAFHEVLGKLFDGDPATKWLAWESAPTIQIEFDAPRTFAAIEITTANDQPARDPASVRVINGETGEAFDLEVAPTRERKTAIRLELPEAMTTSVVRLEISNRGDTRTQLSELSFPE